MPPQIDALTLKTWLKSRPAGGAELALLDVREQGAYATGHLFLAAPAPYSRFESVLPLLAPNRSVRLVLCDGGEGVAARAALRAQALGYGGVAVLAGGAPAWRKAGYTLFEGVNVPSKAFGEIVEAHAHTPQLTARELASMQRAGADLLVVDGRPFAEYEAFNIPTGICCPNGELALRIADLAPDPHTTIVVNCAGRTRSIIGAQTLIDLGVQNRVFALENGTQGWRLAGLELERGARRRYPAEPAAPRDIAELRRRARRFAEASGAAFVRPGEAANWPGEAARTTFLFDVRTREEFVAGAVRGFVHAPGGQLIQATDQFIGVRGARLVVLDGEEVRAPVVAGWLRQLGHEAFVLEGGAAAAAAHRFERPAAPRPDLPNLQPIGVAETADGLRSGVVTVLDLRPGMTYRGGHIAGSSWTIRPRIAADAGANATIVLVADDPAAAALAALDLREAGRRDIRVLAGGFPAWRDAGLPVEATPGRPADAECIDFVFFTHDRQSNPQAARRYLAWETALAGRLDEDERRVFRLRQAHGRCA